MLHTHSFSLVWRRHYPEAATKLEYLLTQSKKLENNSQLQVIFLPKLTPSHAPFQFSVVRITQCVQDTLGGLPLTSDSLSLRGPKLKKMVEDAAAFF